MEHDTPLPEATGLGTSETEVTADFEERADIKLLRLGLDSANEECEVLAVVIVAVAVADAADCVLQSAEFELIKGVVEVNAKAEVDGDVDADVDAKSGAAEPGREVMSSYAGGDALAPVNLGPIAGSQVRSESD
jgi:hypothetical protein